MKLTVKINPSLYLTPILTVDQTATSSHAQVQKFIEDNIEAEMTIYHTLEVCVERIFRKPNGVKYKEGFAYRVKEDKLKPLLLKIPDLQIQQQQEIARDLLDLVLVGLGSALFRLDETVPLFWLTIVDIREEIVSRPLLEVKSIDRTSNDFVRNIASKAMQVVVTILPYNIITITELRLSDLNQNIRLISCHKYRFSSEQLAVWLDNIEKTSRLEPEKTATETLEMLAELPLLRSDSDIINDYL